MKKQNFRLGCPVLSREAQRMTTDIPSVRQMGDASCFLAFAHAVSLVWNDLSLLFFGSYSLSLSLGISSSIQEDFLGFTIPPHPIQAGLGSPMPPSTHPVVC